MRIVEAVKQSGRSGTKFIQAVNANSFARSVVSRSAQHLWQRYLRLACLLQLTVSVIHVQTCLGSLDKICAGAEAMTFPDSGGYSDEAQGACTTTFQQGGTSPQMIQPALKPTRRTKS